MRKQGEQKNNTGRAGAILFKSEAHALGFFGATRFADDRLVAAFTLRDRFAKTHLRLLDRHDTTLQHLAVEATNEVLVGLALVFSCYFDCHNVMILSHFLLRCKGFIRLLQLQSYQCSVRNSSPWRWEQAMKLLAGHETLFHAFRTV